MILISVTNFHLHENIYSVVLGNGGKFEFTSEKKCKKFLSDLSKFLTENYNQLNLLFGDTFLLYRQNYFFFDDNRKKRHANLYQLRRNINSQVTIIESSFEKLSFIRLNSNANQLAFNQLFLICDNLTAIIIACNQINQNKSYAPVLVRSEFLLKQVLEIENSLKTYSLSKAVSFEPPYFSAVNTAFEPLMKVI